MDIGYLGNGGLSNEIGSMDPNQHDSRGRYEYGMSCYKLMTRPSPTVGMSYLYRVNECNE